MLGTIIILVCFLLGIFTSLTFNLPSFLKNKELTTYVLYFMIFFVGIGIGSDKESFKTLKRLNFKIILVPLIVIIGTLAGAAFASVFLPDISLKDSLAVGAGFGYYSLSAIFITKISGETLGVIALVSNVLREIITLVATPLILRYFGKLAPIACGGATSMDTSLPIISKYVGKDYAIIAVFSGTVLTFLVPFLVPFILTFF